MKKLLLFSAAAMLSAAGLNAQTTSYPDAIADVMPSVSLGTTLQMESQGTSTITELADKTIRRAIVKGDYMYVLALDATNAPFIYLINLTNNAVTSVSTEGTTAPTNAEGLLISDIAVTADGYLMACNYDKTPVNSTTAYTYIYSWDKDNTIGIPTGGAKVWYKSNMAGLCSNAMSGASISYSGNLNDGTAMMSCDHLSSGSISGKMRFMKFTKVDGELIKEEQASASGVTNVYGNLNTIYHTIYGSKYTFNVSPVNEANFILDGTLAGATELSYEGLALKADFTVVSADTKVDASVTNASYFKAAGSALMVAPVVTDGKCAGVQLLNVTDGLASASQLSSLSITSNDASLDNIHTCGRSLVDGTEGKVEVYVLRGNELIKYASVSGILTGIESIETDANAPVEYYNLQGVKVANPEKGLFIKKQGSKTTKVVL